MKNLMFHFNAKKKISITSALFSLLILFFTLNCGFCGNFCSAEYSGTDDGFNHEETTTEIKTQKNGEEDENENNEEDKKDDETKKNNEEEDKTESTEAPESKRGDLCPKCILL